MSSNFGEAKQMQYYVQAMRRDRSASAHWQATSRWKDLMPLGCRTAIACFQQVLHGSLLIFFCRWMINETSQVLGAVASYMPSVASQRIYELQASLERRCPWPQVINRFGGALLLIALLILLLGAEAAWAARSAEVPADVGSVWPEDLVFFETPLKNFTSGCLDFRANNFFGVLCFLDYEACLRDFDNRISNISKSEYPKTQPNDIPPKAFKNTSRLHLALWLRDVNHCLANCGLGTSEKIWWLRICWTQGAGFWKQIYFKG